MSFATRLGMVSLVICGACDAPARQSPPPSTPPPAPAPAIDAPAPLPTIEPIVDFDDPPIDGALLRRADGYDELVLRLDWPIGPRFSNVFYEGNNVAMRGDRSDSQKTFLASGEEVARHWREAANSGRGVFVLRDALFSQQDHPIDMSPFAISIPSSWVTVAVHAASTTRTLGFHGVPASINDPAWDGLAVQEVFGAFPISERVSLHAARPFAGLDEEETRRTVHARSALQQLAACAARLEAAVAISAEEAARTGAACISESDRRYFGPVLRRNRVIPITVENPTAHEVNDEGKGFVVAGRDTPADEVRLARDAVCRRRLADGPLALERYDLTQESERARAIEVLEALIPEGSSGPNVWLWINGGLDERGIGGDPALPRVPTFLAQVEAANVETSRLRLLDKPHVDLRNEREPRRRLDEAVAAYGAQHMVVSTNLSSRALAALIE